MKAGAKLNFGKAEVYWPQDDSSSDKYQTLLGVKSNPSAQSKELIEPTFDAKVRIDAQIDIKVTPEVSLPDFFTDPVPPLDCTTVASLCLVLTDLPQANMGLRIGGKISGGSTLVDAQLVGYVNTSLSFQASGTGSVDSTGTAASYRYGIYLIYNLGYGAYATIKFFPNWALKPRNAFNPAKRFTIYQNTGSFTGPTRRSIEAPVVIAAPKFPRRGLISDWHGAELSAIDQVHRSLHLDESSNLNHNQSHAMSMQSLLGKRADDSLPDSQNADFTTQLTCPPGDSAQVRIPDYRRTLSSSLAMFCFLLIDQSSQRQHIWGCSSQRKRSASCRTWNICWCP